MGASSPSIPSNNSVQGNLQVTTPASVQRVSVEGVGPTYRGGVLNFTPAATPTDIFAIGLGAYGNAATLKRIRISGTATSIVSVSTIDVLLQKSGNGGGGTAVSCYVGKLDNQDAGPSHFSQYYTANRSSGGNGVSASRPILGHGLLTFATATTTGVDVEFDFGDFGAKSPTLKNLSDWLVMNLNGQTMPTGAAFAVFYEVQEERMFRMVAYGDSTTALAYPYLFNGGNNFGGIGTAGLMNTQSTLDNLGSNGFRLYDALTNTNGVTYPQYVMQNGAYDIILACYLINDIRTGQCSLNQAIALLDSMIFSILNGVAAAGTINTQNTAGAYYTSPKATVFAIQSMVLSGGTVTVTTVNPHGWQTNGTVNVDIEGVTPSAYNGQYAATITGPTTFTYSLGGSPGAVTVQGACAYTIVWPHSAVALPDAKIILWGPNGFTADDAGAGAPNHYLSYAGNTTLSGLWNGMTLAQAALAASQLMYSAYAAFANDTRVFKMIQKQDLMTVSPVDNVTPVAAFPNHNAVANLANTPTTATNLPTPSDQIHMNTQRGETLLARQIVPVLVQAIEAIQPVIAY